MDSLVNQNDPFVLICQRISDIHNNKIFTSLEELEALFTEFIKQLFMRAFQVDIPPIVEIIEDERRAASYDGYITFKLNRKEIMAFQNGKALSIFESIFHELNHFRQKRVPFATNISIFNSYFQKDKFLLDHIPNYYDDNYDLLIFEIDAYLSQGIDAKALLNNLGIIPSEEELAESKASYDHYKAYAFTLSRIVNDAVVNLDDTFTKVFSERALLMDDFDKSNFLKFNPCIELEYKVVGENFVPKTGLEIEQLYNEWQSGKLKLQGDPHEIDAYFKFLIEKMKLKVQTKTS